MNRFLNQSSNLRASIAKKTMFVGSSSFSMERWFSIQGRVGFYEDIHTKQRRARLYFGGI